ncbi:MAG: hypothetical protein KTR21_00425 [Rhodobacteraceae bacterium]|nr:hypothetical protein [Paracoccaceae bacterium]
MRTSNFSPRLCAKRLAQAAVGAAALILAASCGAKQGGGRVTNQVRPVLPIPDKPPGGPAFSFSIESELQRADFAENLARHALACWVREDPAYRVGGPTPRGEATLVSLIYVGEAQPTATAPPDSPLTEGLRIALSERRAGRYGLDVSGPLASQEFAQRIRQGVALVAFGSPNCT